MPKIEIIHGGQTGVDRGAHQAGRQVAGWMPAGFCPQDGKDELGLIPRDVAQYLTPYSRPGYGARTRGNLQVCNALLVVVESCEHAAKTPGTRMTLEHAAKLGRDYYITDLVRPAWAAAEWVQDRVDQFVQMNRVGPFRLMVAGPRESKWPRARGATFAILIDIATEMKKLTKGKA